MEVEEAGHSAEKKQGSNTGVLFVWFGCIIVVCGMFGGKNQPGEWAIMFGGKNQAV
jgi:hypothetical protein